MGPQFVRGHKAALAPLCRTTDALILDVRREIAAPAAVQKPRTVRVLAAEHIAARVPLPPRPEAVVVHMIERVHGAACYRKRVTLSRSILSVGLAVVIGVVATSALAETFSGKVVGVVDGDTIDVLHAGRAERVRLIGIDCPEKRQAFGQRAKQATSDLAFGTVVTVAAPRRDRYGRLLGDVMLPDGTNLNRELVRRGMAWWYRKYSTDRRLEATEAAARQARRGLWADANPIPPWEWRRRR